MKKLTVTIADDADRKTLTDELDSCKILYTKEGNVLKVGCTMKEMEYFKTKPSIM